MKVDAGDIISSIALVISVASFFLNRSHTNKVFQQSSNPELDLKIDVRDSYGTFYIVVHNLHTSVTTSVLHCTLAFRLQGRYADAPWTDYSHDKLDPIKPLAFWDGYLEGPKLVAGLTQHHPDFVAIENYPPNTKQHMPFMLKEQRWDIRLTIRYRGAIAGAKELTRTAELSIVPITKRTHFTNVGETDTAGGASMIMGWKRV